MIIKLTAANVVFTTRHSTPTLSQTHTSLYIHGCDDLVARGVHRESQRPSVSFGVESHQSWHRNHTLEPIKCMGVIRTRFARIQRTNVNVNIPYLVQYLVTVTSYNNDVKYTLRWCKSFVETVTDHSLYQSSITTLLMVLKNTWTWIKIQRNRSADVVQVCT